MSLKSTVISFVPFDIREEKPGLLPSRFFIPASDMKTPSLLHISTASHYVYLDESRGSLKVPDPSDQVARSIVEDYVESQLGISDDAKPALFWVPDELLAEEIHSEMKVEIVRYLLLQKKWFLNVAMMADRDWQNYHQHNVISSFQRTAAKIIGWTRDGHEWMEPQDTMNAIPCPSCGQHWPKSIVVTPCCKVIVNKEKYAELEFAQSR